MQTSETVQNLGAFPSLVSEAEIFRAVEALPPGGEVMFQVDHSPEAFVQSIQSARLGRLELMVQMIDDTTWEIHIKKPKQTGGGCCGVCGGHD